MPGHNFFFVARSMASDTVDAAIKTCDLSPSGGCCTEKRIVEGGEGWGPTYYIRLAQQYGLDVEVCKSEFMDAGSFFVVQNDKRTIIFN